MTEQATMRAAVIEGFGPADTLRTRDLPVPVPGLPGVDQVVAALSAELEKAQNA